MVFCTLANAEVFGGLVGVLDPNDSKVMTEAKAFALRDPEGFEAMFSKLRIMYPPQGRTEAPDKGTCERVQIVNAARTEFRGMRA